MSGAIGSSTRSSTPPRSHHTQQARRLLVQVETTTPRTREYNSRAYSSFDELAASAAAAAQRGRAKHRDAALSARNDSASSASLCSLNHRLICVARSWSLVSGRIHSLASVNQSPPRHSARFPSVHCLLFHFLSRLASWTPTRTNPVTYWTPYVSSMKRTCAIDKERSKATSVQHTRQESRCARARSKQSNSPEPTTQLSSHAPLFRTLFCVCLLSGRSVLLEQLEFKCDGRRA